MLVDQKQDLTTRRFELCWCCDEDKSFDESDDGVLVKSNSLLELFERVSGFEGISIFSYGCFPVDACDILQ